jgi:hypothetical protein
MESRMGRHSSEETLARWMQETRMPEHSSIQPLILDFARGDSSSEVACAHLTMLMAGYPVPLQWATNGFDMHRKAWFIRAMMEHANDALPGFTEAELEPVWRRYPSLRRRAEAAEAAWKRN